MAFLKRFNDENGATSVLVILMMIVLVSLGYFAIASANSNIKLSNNALDWNMKYYDLDAKGEAFIAAMDEKLAAAQALTDEYMASESYLQLTHGALPMEIQYSFYQGYPEALDKQLFLENTMDIVYLFYADKEIEKLKEEYPTATISVLKTGDEVTAIICDYTFTSEESLDFHLDVSATVNYLSTFVNSRLSGSETTSRYRITNWSQWQNLPNESDDSKVWDGTINLPQGN